jgi:hypothetical protein
MNPRTNPLVASFLVAGLAAGLAACGGSPQAAPATPPPAPSAAASTEAAAPASAAPPSAGTAPQPTTPGPNLTPDGVVFNFKPDGKPAKIFLAGNFNAWNPSDPKYLLKDDGPPNGLWSITVKLAPGTYQYKFVADGKWIKDPSSPGSAPDGFGGQNGQFDVK